MHVVGSLAFLALPLLWGPDAGNPTGQLADPHVLRDFIGHIFVLAFFYLHYYWLIPRLYLRKRYGRYFGAVLVCFWITAQHPTLHWNPTPPRAAQPPQEAVVRREGNVFADFRHNALRFSLVYFISLILRIQAYWRQTEEEKKNAELAFLKAQINPHFLFNTLNSLYALAIEKSDETPDAIARLSGMMRYITTEADRDQVALDKELEYLRNYIALQRIRFGDTVRLSFQIQGDPIGHKIAPLALIPFVENAFKYGVNPEEDAEIRISLQIIEASLRLHTANRKVSVKTWESEGAGIGMANTRRRLDLFYPGRHLLVVDETEEEYHLTLTIHLL